MVALPVRRGDFPVTSGRSSSSAMVTIASQLTQNRRICTWSAALAVRCLRRTKSALGAPVALVAERALVGKIAQRSEGCPSLPDLVKRYEAAGGQYYVCPICFNAKALEPAALIGGAELQGTLPLWAWIGEDSATTFSY
jgi:hypothetical protein